MPIEFVKLYAEEIESEMQPQDSDADSAAKYHSDNPNRRYYASLEADPGLILSSDGSFKTKEDLVAYLRNAFTYAHAAMPKMTAENMTDEVQAWWGKSPRLSMANVAMWHSFDHYGQLVLYLRMNGIVPPASRPKQ